MYRTNGNGGSKSVSYTHLDVYKRQVSTLDKVSGIWFSTPFIYSQVKLYSCNANTHLVILLCVNLQVFKKDNALWSVRMIVEFPNR